MLGLGVPELLLILLVVLIFFGADKIPQLAKSLGKGMSEFRKAQQELKDEVAGEESKTVQTAENTDTAAPYQTVCPSCNGKTSRDSAFCSQCGQQMPAPPVCSGCRHAFLNDEKFCPECGQTRPS